MAHCDNALEAIGRAIVLYQQNNDGSNPPNFKILLEQSEELTAWEFICPVSCEPVGRTSYVYRGCDLDAGASAEMVLAYDRAAVHKGRRNILFADGAVTRPKEAGFEKAIERDNELRRVLLLPPKDPHAVGPSEKTL